MINIHIGSSSPVPPSTRTFHDLKTLLAVKNKGPAGVSTLMLRFHDVIKTSVL